MSEPSDQHIGEVLLARLWLFQAIVAAPTFVILGIEAVLNMFNTYATLYDFITDLCTAIMAMGIIFVVLVQQKLPTAGKALTVRFEIIKSVLATLLWIWLMADSIWGPSSHHRGGYGNGRGSRIVGSCFVSILLFILFYPSVYYTHYYWPSDASGQARDDVESGERAPLLQGQQVA